MPRAGHIFRRLFPGKSASIAVGTSPIPVGRSGVSRLSIGANHARVSRAFSVRSRTEGDRLFRAAVRHSRSVRALRVAIPVFVVLGGLAAVLATTLLDPLRALAKLPVDIGSVAVSGTKITMKQPRLAGFTRDSRPYEVTAVAAAQDVTNPDLLEMREIRAIMEMQSKAKINMTAKDGLYDTKSGLLTLRRDIIVTSTAGYEGHLSEAVIDVRKVNVVSEKPVQVKMLQGTIDSNRMEVKNSGEVLLFDGGVTMVLTSLNTGGGEMTSSIGGARSAEAK